GGGGEIRGRASHYIDLQRALGGEIVRAQAAGSRVELRRDAYAEQDVEDVISLQLGLARGGLATVQMAWTPAERPQRHVLDVVSDEAELELALGPALHAHGVARVHPLALADEG